MPLPHRRAALDGESVARLMPTVPAWTLREGRWIEREFRFPDFRAALDFANRVGAVAEAEDHHPELLVSWGKVGVALTTHSAGGLTENDFALAARIDSV